MPKVVFTKKLKTKDGKQMIGEGAMIVEPEIVNPYHLLGGFWKNHENDKGGVLKRRSPLSISAMVPIHPLLSSILNEDISYNRRNTENVSVKFIDEKNGNEVYPEKLSEILKNLGKRMEDFSPTQFIQDQKRTSGLFKFDVAIDLRTLFAVNLSETDPEIYQEEIETLKKSGWKEIDYDFGKAIVAPKELREKIAKAVAKGIVNWRIQTNQSTTFSPMPTIALSVSNNAHDITNSIRAELVEEEKANIVIDDSCSKVFSSDSIKGFVASHKKTNDIKDAEEYIYNKIMEFDFEHQK
jgi:hypothetical protein